MTFVFPKTESRGETVEGKQSGKIEFRCVRYARKGCPFRQVLYKIKKNISGNSVAYELDSFFTKNCVSKKVLYALNFGNFQSLSKNNFFFNFKPNYFLSKPS